MKTINEGETIRAGDKGIVVVDQITEPASGEIKATMYRVSEARVKPLEWRESLISKYTSGSIRDAVEERGIPYQILRQHFSEFADELLVASPEPAADAVVVTQRGSSNPILAIPETRVREFLHTIADEAGYADREMMALQVYAGDDKTPYLTTTGDFVLMVSNIPNSRSVLSQPAPASQEAPSGVVEAAFRAGFDAGEANGKFDDDNTDAAFARYLAQPAPAAQEAPSGVVERLTAEPMTLTDADGNRYTVINRHAPTTPADAEHTDLIVRPVPLTPLEKLRKMRDEWHARSGPINDGEHLLILAIDAYLESAGVR